MANKTTATSTDGTAVKQASEDATGKDQRSTASAVAPLIEQRKAERTTGLSEVERRLMKAANVPDAEIDRIDAERRARGQKKQKTKVNLSGLLAEHAEKMIEECGGKSLFSGRSIGTWLIARGLAPEVRG